MDTRTDKPASSGWWARMPDGGTKRLWVTREDDGYHCRLELWHPSQEPARAGERPASSQSLVARSADEALRFLGSDEAARAALHDADLRAAP